MSEAGGVEGSEERVQDFSRCHVTLELMISSRPSLYTCTDLQERIKMSVLQLLRKTLRKEGSRAGYTTSAIVSVFKMSPRLTPGHLLVWCNIGALTSTSGLIASAQRLRPKPQGAASLPLAFPVYGRCT